jgi:hypothetical protein
VVVEKVNGGGSKKRRRQVYVDDGDDSDDSSKSSSKSEVEEVYGDTQVEEEEMDRTEPLQGQGQTADVQTEQPSSTTDTQGGSEESRVVHNVDGSATAETPAAAETPATETMTPASTPTPAIVVDSTSSTKTVVSDVTDEQQEEYLLDQPAIKKELNTALVSFVNKCVFPVRKFPMGKEAEMKYCRIAALEKKVELPSGVTRKVFGKKFHRTIGKRVNALRGNAHASMREKYESKF